MVVLLNSAKFNRTILALLPSYCRTHYHFLKDRFPDYFPDLDWEGTGVTSEAHTLRADRRYSTSSFSVYWKCTYSLLQGNTTVFGELGATAGDSWETDWREEVC